MKCPKCGYVQTETPYWLEQAYVHAINRSDTGLLRRNARNCCKPAPGVARPVA